MKLNTLFTILVVLVLSSCQTLPPLPNQPKEVVKQWQEWINSNDFESAKRLSTPNTISWIDWAEKMLLDEEGDSVESSTYKFQSVNCLVSGKKAICPCVIEDLGEVYQDTFYLQQKGSQWLVDIPSEDLELSGDLDAIFSK